ncbi:nucleotidyl transferase AbiEii/AbiGii toxin family protein [bacterium]|nr:nucleotidyl transferase AbiEii/AbiGii toxin family protein [bacterium]
MLSLEEIKKQFPSDVNIFERGILREYLQYLILEITFNSNISTKLSFLGGTCLRIVHGIKRFSEDLDFDNKNLTIEEFTSLAKNIGLELKRQGFDVETSITEKKSIHCHVKFSGILFASKLSNTKSEKIDIQIDTFDQGYEYTPELYLLNKFNVFKQIRITPKTIILAQKLWTITQRNRSKGRDYYDIIQLLQNTKPDIGFLKLKFESSSLGEIKAKILESISNVNLEEVAKDVEPFLVNVEESKKIFLFRDYLKQISLE